MGYTYPAPPATIGSDLTTVEIHHLLKTPTVLRKRMLELSAQKYIADYLLAGRYKATGGAILYETGEEIFPADSVEAVAPGAAYPTTVLTAGELAAAKTQKWGRDVYVTDEAIGRLNIDAVNRALVKLRNGNVRDVDSVALAVIAAKVTQAISVGAGGVNTGAWSTAAAIIEGVLAVKAQLEEDNVGEGYDYDVVALKPTQFAKVAGKLISGNMLPREGQNAVLTGVIQDYMGLTWVTSTHAPFTDPFLVDRNQLGGMADEDLGSPGYAGGLGGVETKSIRDEDYDRYKVRARRVTVPVVTQPLAGAAIEDTGI